MNNGNTPTNLNLPPPIPQGEELPGLPAAEAVNGQLPEKGPAAASEVAASPPPVLPVMSLPPTSLNTQQQKGSAANAANGPSIADDNDLIEKEWVTKAKQIVEKTRENPYVQNKELSVFKADYMKKRYNKTIKLSE
jgi:hypothetical protein